VDANSGDKISFYWKVSSEENGDYLKFLVDDDVKYEISGDVDWHMKTYTITSTGPHTLEWRFIRDSGGDSGGEDNCGWVDFVQWTQPSPTQDPDNWYTIKYKYDPSGRRIEKNVDGYKTRYIYDGGNVIAEYDGNGNLTRKYIHGARVDELVCMIDVADSSAVYYYHYDGLGSVVALSDSSGDSCQSYEYSAYGQVAASDPNFTANLYLFTGRRFDYETGLYYYRARYYNPYIGRFLQTDPIGYGDGINWYAYCGNNPLAYTDPSGLVVVAFYDPTFEVWEQNEDGEWVIVDTIDLMEQYANDWNETDGNFHFPMNSSQDVLDKIQELLDAGIDVTDVFFYDHSFGQTEDLPTRLYTSVTS